MIFLANILVLMFTYGWSIPVPSSSTPNNPNVKYTEYRGEPAVAMFRNFVSSFPPYANPMNYIPKEAFPGGYGQQGSYGMGYAGPFTGNGSPNPFFNFKPPGVPGVPGIPGMPGAPGAPGIPGVPGVTGSYGGGVGLDTRMAGGGGSAVSPPDDSGVGYVAVTADNGDGQPVLRTKTVQGPNSYGSAFAYSSG